MKRYIYIIIGIIVAAAIAILILLLIKNNAANSLPSISGTATTGSLPAVSTQGSNGSGTTSSVPALGLSPVATSTGTSANAQTAVQNFGVLSQSPVFDYFIDVKNNITAIQPTGAIITIANGQTKTLSSSTIDGIISASFSYDGKKIVVRWRSYESAGGYL